MRDLVTLDAATTKTTGRAFIELASLATAVLFFASYDTILNSAPNVIPEICIANGVILAVALHGDVRSAEIRILVGLGATVLARLLTGQPAAEILGLTITDAGEILVCAVGLRRITRDTPIDLTRPPTLLAFCTLAIVFAPLLSSSCAALVLHMSRGADSGFAFINWYPTHALGLITVTPFVLALQTRAMWHLWSRERLFDTLFVLLVLSVVLAVSSAQHRYPLLFLAFPALIYVSFRLGFPGIVTAVALTVAASLTALMADTGPMALIPGSFAEKTVVLQLYLAVVTLMGLLVVSTLAEANRMRRRFETARTDSVAAKMALSTSETRYRILAETTSDVITRVSLDSIREYVSPTCRRVFGYDPHEMMGIRPSDLIHADDAPRVREAARQLIDGEVADSRLTLTYRTKHKLGHYIWVEAGINLGRDEAGVPDALVCSLRDVTERRNAEAAVEASEARFRLLAENTSELIILGHDNERLSYVSPASLRLLSYAPKDLIERQFTDLAHADDVAMLRATLRRIGDPGTETATTFRALKKTGEMVWLEGIFRRIPDAIADGPAVVATFRDVSERKAQSNALQEAKDAAERANQAKTDFLASMSHEIRTPLNSILGYTDLLSDDLDLSVKQRKQIERVQHAGTALLTIVNDILDFSTIEAGRVELNHRPFLIYQLVDSAVSIVQGIASKKNLDLSVEIAPDMPGAFLGDPDRLGQILLNLLNNAVKFTPSGSVRLDVTKRDAAKFDATKFDATRLDGDGADRVGLRFAVTDTGIGIPAEKRAKLFERFSQVDGSVRRDFGGTGLGLAISKNLVELMGGGIGVESTLAAGSTFWFELDLPVAEVAITAPWDTTVAHEKRSARILLVEDLEINRDLARAIIQAWDHEVDEACDGAEAVEAVQRKAYDLVLMDVQMPGMDGMSATRAIRALDLPCRNVPILAMTANVLPAQVAMFREAGMNDHVGKPIRRPDLQAAIMKWAGTTQDQDAVARHAPDHAEAIDREIYRELLSIVGQAQMDVLLRKLAALLQGRGRLMADAQRPELAHGAHAIVSAAGSLGFSRLSNLCRDLEAACAGDGALDTLLGHVEAERRRALGVIEELKSA